MSVKLITYDLDKPGQDYTDLLREIRKFPSTRLSESSYAVDTDLSPSQLHARLKPYVDENDTIYVLVLNHPYAGYGPEKVNAWLEGHLTYAQVLA